MNLQRGVTHLILKQTSAHETRYVMCSLTRQSGRPHCAITLRYQAATV